MGHPNPVNSRRLPVKLAIARWTMAGFFPAFQAITASTANSGIVWMRARTARASPWDIRNSAASAPHATTKAAPIIAGKVQNDAQEEDAAACPAADANALRPRASLIARGYSMEHDAPDRVRVQSAHSRNRPRPRVAHALPARGREGHPRRGRRRDPP